jgi:hypothetical protein
MGVQRSRASSFAKLTVNNTVGTPRLSILSPYIIQNGLASVSNGFRVEIWCAGSGHLTWVSSSGVVTDQSDTPNSPINLYQEHDPMSNVQTLVIQSFSPGENGRYACSVLTENEGAFATASVYISSCKCRKGILNLAKLLSAAPSAKMCPKVSQ